MRVPVEILLSAVYWCVVVMGLWVSCFQLRRILRIWVTVLDLAVSWLSRFQVVVLGLFDFSQSRVSGFFLR